MRIKTSYLWEKGNRPVQEDALMIFHIIINKRPLLLAAVADGIGGLPQGENASSYLLSHLHLSLEKFLNNPGKITLSRIKRMLHREIYRAHMNILSYADKHHISMGCTLSLVCIYCKRGFIFHIGDGGILLNGVMLTTPQIDSQGRLINALGIGVFKSLNAVSIYPKINEQYIVATDGYLNKSRGSRDNSSAVLINIVR